MQKFDQFEFIDNNLTGTIPVQIMSLSVLPISLCVAKFFKRFHMTRDWQVS